MDDTELIGWLPMSPTVLSSIVREYSHIQRFPPPPHPHKSGAGCAVLLDGLALAVALFKEANIVLDVFIVRVLAPGGGKRRMRALVVAAQHV